MAKRILKLEQFNEGDLVVYQVAPHEKKYYGIVTEVDRHRVVDILPGNKIKTNRIKIKYIHNNGESYYHKGETSQLKHITILAKVKGKPDLKGDTLKKSAKKITKNDIW